jgi:hypothetical protein
MNNLRPGRTIEVSIHGDKTDAAVFASRGRVLYCVGSSVRSSVFLMRALDVDGGQELVVSASPEVIDYKPITIADILSPNAEKIIAETVRSYFECSGLNKGLAHLQDEVLRIIDTLISSIPEAVGHDTSYV